MFPTRKLVARVPERAQDTTFKAIAGQVLSFGSFLNVPRVSGIVTSNSLAERLMIVRLPQKLKNNQGYIVEARR